MAKPNTTNYGSKNASGNKMPKGNPGQLGGAPGPMPKNNAGMTGKMASQSKPVRKGKT